MNQNKIEFFAWIKEIEFKNWKNYYINYFENTKDENISKWIKKHLNSLKDLNFELNKFKEENLKLISKLDDQINNKFNLKKEEKELSKIYELMISINENLNFIDNKNYNKVKKHKIIYFMISFAIYKNKSYLAWEKYDDIFKLFLFDIKRENVYMKWCAFENGPILKNIYRWNGIDKEIYFNNNLTEDQFKILESAYFLLKKYPISILINKSHETDPWKNVFKSKSYYQEIKKEDIIKYFKKNKPFFVNF